MNFGWSVGMDAAAIVLAAFLLIFINQLLDILSAIGG